MIDDIDLNHDFDVGYAFDSPEIAVDSFVCQDDFSIEDYEFRIGDPDPSGWVIGGQTTDFTCAVVSQQMILNEFGIVNPGTGLPLSEAQLTYDATINGWLNGGTSPDDVGKLLEYYGVDCHHGYGLEEMASELAQGHKVIVGVDSKELWNSDNAFLNDLEDVVLGEQANHAIVVKGIKVGQDGETTVVINDPGTPDGAGNEYPLDIFLDAFEDGDCHYVATDYAPPGLGTDPIFGANFNPTEGRYAGSDQWGGNVRPNDDTFESPTIESHFRDQDIDMLSDLARKNILKNI